MKKILYTLLILFEFVFQPVLAWDYFTIYFHDGSQSEKFYAVDVDSICYSKVGLDSIIHSDWQVQEIWAIDTVYRYYLIDIDSISFTKVNIDEVAKDITNATSFIEPLFFQSDSTSELIEHLSIIKNREEIEDAWIDGQALYINIRNYGPMIFLYPPSQNIDNEDVISPLYSTKARSQLAMAVPNDKSHHFLEAKKACIVNQPYYDEDRNELIKIVNSLNNSFEVMGIETKIENKPLPEFFDNHIYGYDLVFIITHGCFIDNKHWLLTGEELILYEGYRNLTKESKEVEWARMLRDAIYESNKRQRHSLNDMRVCWVKEKRNGVKQGVIYTLISENYIKDSNCNFTNKAIVFNAACESLKGNDSFGKVFINKGAGCYLGYTDANTVGGTAGDFFFSYLLNGKCTDGAYASIPEKYRKEDKLWIDMDLPFFHTIHPELKIIPIGNAICITRPQTSTIENQTYGESEVILLKGNIKVLSSNKGNNEFGFQLSTNPDMSQAVDSTAVGIYDSTTLYMNWADTIDVNTLQPNTTYYYRAYMNDGYSNCYGEVKSFTTENVEAYAVLNDGTLTFYYDGKQKERVGGVFKISFFNNKYHYFEPWYDDVYIVDFDPSFYYYTPVRTYCWFNLFHNLTEVRNIKWLNTSKITEMGWMFANCNSLKALDLRSFDTSNVIGMKCMFENCSSLTYLDMSSFDTHNVTNMWGMFDGCCSLPTIDVSNFDTSNVTEMPALFKNCSSIRSLDLSHFKVSSDTSIQYMFQYCSSLTTIYAGNWNTGVWSNKMFEHCDNLVGGRGTKVGRNYYIDENGEQRYYDCSPNGSSAHIDGGKDNPGLFTAK